MIIEFRAHDPFEHYQHRAVSAELGKGPGAQPQVQPQLRLRALLGRRRLGVRHRPLQERLGVLHVWRPVPHGLHRVSIGTFWQGPGTSMQSSTPSAYVNISSVQLLPLNTY